MANSEMIANVCLGAASSLGVVLNSISVYYIFRRFCLGKTVFLLLLVDAAVSLASSTAAIGAAIALRNNVVTCMVRYLSGYFPTLLGNLITAEIAIIRLYSLRLATRNVTMDETKVKKFSLFLFLLPALYISLLVMVCCIYRTPFSMIFETCVHGDESPRPSRFLKLFYILPNVILPLATLVADANIVFIVKTNLKQGRRSASTIPVRATALSAAMLLPSFAIGALFQASGLSKTNSATLSALMVKLVVAFRCPVTTAVCFAHKHRMEETARRDTRENRLQKELQYAMKAIKKTKEDLELT